MHGTLAIALPKFGERDFSTAATASDNVVDKWWGIRGVRDNYGSTMKFHARSTITRSKRTISSGTSYSFSFFFFFLFFFFFENNANLDLKYKEFKSKVINVFKVIGNFVKNCLVSKISFNKWQIIYKRIKIQ